MSDSVTLPGGVEVTAEGGPVLLVAFALLAAVLVIVLGLWIAVVVYRGYRKTGDRPMLYLATGIVLVASVSTSLRFVLDTAGMSLVVTNSGAALSQSVGLGVILFAIYGAPESRPRQGRAVAVLLPLAVVPVVVMQLGLEGTEVALVAINAVPAGLGLFVTMQAFRGYQRHASRPMLALAVGLVLLTVVPFLSELSLYVGTEMTAAGIAIIHITVELLGLASILYSVTRA